MHVVENSLTQSSTVIFFPNFFLLLTHCVLAKNTAAVVQLVMMGNYLVVLFSNGKLQSWYQHPSQGWALEGEYTELEATNLEVGKKIPLHYF